MYPLNGEICSGKILTILSNTIFHIFVKIKKMIKSTLVKVTLIVSF